MLPINPTPDQGSNHDQGHPNGGEGVPQERPSGLTRRRTQHRREHEIVEEIEAEKARQADEEARKLAEAARNEPPKQANRTREADRRADAKPEKDRT